MKKKNEIHPELKLEKRTIATLSNSLMDQIKGGIKITPTSVEVNDCTGRPITGTMLNNNGQ